MRFAVNQFNFRMVMMMIWKTRLLSKHGVHSFYLSLTNILKPELNFSEIWSSARKIRDLSTLHLTKMGQFLFQTINHSGVL